MLVSLRGGHLWVDTGQGFGTWAGVVRVGGFCSQQHAAMWVVLHPATSDSSSLNDLAPTYSRSTLSTSLTCDLSPCPCSPSEMPFLPCLCALLLYKASLRGQRVSAPWCTLQPGGDVAGLRGWEASLCCPPGC